MSKIYEALNKANREPEPEKDLPDSPDAKSQADLVKEKLAALDSQLELIGDGSYVVRPKIQAELERWETQPPAYRSARDVKYMIDSMRAELLESKDDKGTLTLGDVDARRVVSLDMRTGDKVWESLMDFTGCGGDAMGAAYRDGRVLFFGQHGNHDAWRHILGGMKWHRITTLSAADGSF